MSRKTFTVSLNQEDTEKLNKFLAEQKMSFTEYIRYLVDIPARTFPGHSSYSRNDEPLDIGDLLD